MSHPIKLLVDFDGVIHAYTSKWTRADEILDGPVDGALDWIRKMLAEDVKIAIFTARLSNEPLNENDGPRDHLAVVRALTEWFIEHGLSFVEAGMLEFVTGKPHATLYIDDRARLFRGRFPSIRDIRSHEQWNKADPLCVLGTDVEDAVLAARARGIDWGTIEARVRKTVEMLEDTERTRDAGPQTRVEGVSGAIIAEKVRVASDDRVCAAECPYLRVYQSGNARCTGFGRLIAQDEGDAAQSLFVVQRSAQCLTKIGRFDAIGNPR